MAYMVWLQIDNKLVKVTPKAGLPSWGELLVTEESLITKYLHPDGFPWLHDKTATKTEQALARAVQQIVPDAHRDAHRTRALSDTYHALRALLGWAREQPDAIWEVEQVL